MEKPSSSSAVKAGPAPTPSAPVISEKIMNLKFMQRRRKPVVGTQQQPAAEGKQPKAQQQGAQPVVAESKAATVAELEAQWTLEPATGPAPEPQVVISRQEPSQPANAREALLKFRQGRRSFGKFNPRLEARLAEISYEKEAARRELKAEAEAEATAAQRAELELEKREAAKQERCEAEQMASYYSKYIPTGTAALSAAPPEVHAPVQIGDKPLGKDPGHKKRMLGTPAVLGNQGTLPLTGKSKKPKQSRNP